MCWEIIIIIIKRRSSTSINSGCSQRALDNRFVRRDFPRKNYTGLRPQDRDARIPALAGRRHRLPPPPPPPHLLLQWRKGRTGGAAATMRDAPPPPSCWASSENSSRVSVRESRDPETVPAPAAARSPLRRLPTTKERTGLERSGKRKPLYCLLPGRRKRTAGRFCGLLFLIRSDNDHFPLLYRSPSVHRIFRSLSLFPVALLLLPRGRRTPSIRAVRTSVDPV